MHDIAHAIARSSGSFQFMKPKSLMYCGRWAKIANAARIMLAGRPRVACLPVKGGRHSRLVALLTPYDGGNLGDSAIQHAVIANLRICDPNIQVCGITLEPAKTSALHAVPCYSLAASSRAHYHNTPVRESQVDRRRQSTGGKTVKYLCRRLRAAARGLLFVRWFRLLLQELLHAIRSYLLLRNVCVLVIAGGGQLDDEWGGSWGHPFSLMKWVVLARVSGTPVVFVSVGACRMESRLTRVFLKTALSLASYRSYRDEGSRILALGVASGAGGPVVPDLAFSLPNARCDASDMCVHVPFRVAVSPIAYCHPTLWPTKDPDQYQRYITEIASFISAILQGGVSVSLFSSSPPDDQVFTDICDRLDPRIASAARARLMVCPVNTLRDLLDVLRSVDAVVGSRLHGLLLSFLSGKPAVAISYDRKVTCLMDDLGQAAYCLDIRSFTSSELFTLFTTLRQKRDDIVPAVSALCSTYDRVLQKQYRLITQFLPGRPLDRLHKHDVDFRKTDEWEACEDPCRFRAMP
jgi:polysaccharide pyruvyl transferase WcaK-like protein